MAALAVRTDFTFGATFDRDDEAASFVSHTALQRDLIETTRLALDVAFFVLADGVFDALAVDAQQAVGAAISTEAARESATAVVVAVAADVAFAAATPITARRRTSTAAVVAAFEPLVALNAVSVTAQFELSANGSPTPNQCERKYRQHER